VGFFDSVDVAVPEMPAHPGVQRQVTKHQTGQSQFESWFTQIIGLVGWFFTKESGMGLATPSYLVCLLVNPEQISRVGGVSMFNSSPS